MANTVYFGGVGNQPTLKLALDWAKTQGYETNGQETFFEQAGDIVDNIGSPIIFASYPYVNNLYIVNPNNYTTTYGDILYTNIEYSANFLMRVSTTPKIVINGLKIRGQQVTPRSSNFFHIFQSHTNNSIIISNCDIEINNSINPAAFMYVLGDTPNTIGKVWGIYNNKFVVSNRLFNGSSVGSGNRVYIEDNIFIGGSFGSPLQTGVTSKRNYVNVAPLQDGTLNASNFGWYTVATTGSYIASCPKTGVPFNNTTFFNTDDPTNPLYLVPRASYDWGVIDQTTNIPENVASKNGIMYTGSNRAVGCMALPDNVVEPVLGIAKQGGNVVRLTWNGTAGGVIYTNEVDSFSTATEIGTALTGSTYDYSVPLEDRGKVMYYWVEVL